MKGEAMDETKIFYFNNGMVIIGKPEYETTDVLDETITDLTKITSPRAIMVMQDANGRTVAQMIELFGKPDLIEIMEAPLFIGEVKDKDLYKKYIELTTTLHLAH